MVRLQQYGSTMDYYFQRCFVRKQNFALACNMGNCYCCRRIYFCNRSENMEEKSNDKKTKSVNEEVLYVKAECN